MIYTSHRRRQFIDDDKTSMRQFTETTIHRNENLSTRQLIDSDNLSKRQFVDVKIYRHQKICKTTIFCTHSQRQLTFVQSFAIFLTKLQMYNRRLKSNFFQYPAVMDIAETQLFSEHSVACMYYTINR